MKRRVYLLVTALVALTAALLVCAKTVIVPVLIDGSSMEPTLRNGSLVFLFTGAYRSKVPIRGDVVGVLVSGDLWIKRIIGVQGDTITSSEAGSFGIPPVHLEAGEFFVMGDNREASVGLHVHRNSIVGKAIF